MHATLACGAFWLDLGLLFTDSLTFFRQCVIAKLRYSMSFCVRHSANVKTQQCDLWFALCLLQTVVFTYYVTYCLLFTVLSRVLERTHLVKQHQLQVSSYYECLGMPVSHSGGQLPTPSTHMARDITKMQAYVSPSDESSGEGKPGANGSQGSTSQDKVGQEPSFIHSFCLKDNKLKNAFIKYRQRLVFLIRGRYEAILINEAVGMGKCTSYPGKSKHRSTVRY